MRRVLAQFALAALWVGAMGSSHIARAWWDTGHQVSATITWAELSPETRVKIAHLLAAHPDYATTFIKESTPEDQRGLMAFQMAAIWPDLVRNGPEAHTYSHPNWHYVDMPYALRDFKLPEPPVMKWSPDAEPENLSQAYAKCLADLKNEKLPDSQRAIALAWIIHMTEDIHQPLHAASLFSDELPRGDQGGNLVIVKAAGNVTNLHALWDGQLGGGEPLEVVGKKAEEVHKAHPRSEFAEKLKEKDLETWVKESFEQAKALAYLNGQLKFVTREQSSGNPNLAVPEVSEEYLAHAKSAAQADVALAAYRLADTLEAALGSAKAQ